VIRSVRLPTVLAMASLLAVAALALVVLTLWPQQGERINPTTRPVAHSVQLMLMEKAQAWDSANSSRQMGGRLFLQPR
jgi:hypothetical protein